MPIVACRCRHTARKLTQRVVAVGEKSLCQNDSLDLRISMGTVLEGNHKGGRVRWNDRRWHERGREDLRWTIQRRNREVSRNR